MKMDTGEQKWFTRLPPRLGPGPKGEGNAAAYRNPRRPFFPEDGTACCAPSLPATAIYYGNIIWCVITKQ